MTAPQKFSNKLEEKPSDHERSILLVNIMNVMGFSKGEREIRRHTPHLLNVLSKSFRTPDTCTYTQTGSIAEGMCGGIYSKQDHHDIDLLCTAEYIKLYTPRTNNINNHIVFRPHGNEDYDASYFVEEDDNFPGYVKLSLAELNTYAFIHCTTMHDDKLYFSYFSKKHLIPNIPFGPMKESVLNFLNSHIMEINGPAFTIHNRNNRGRYKTMDGVFCIHYDVWPKSADLFITRRKPNNWPSINMLENIKSQGCDVVPVGHNDSKNNDIQWRISFPGERSLLLDLTDVQILCYALIKIILIENLNTSQREVVSSFHIKNVIFWCVELCSCQWVDSNYINCLNMCLTQLIEMIKVRHIPHYIIESRNLFNSKMTETMSMEIVDVLSKFDTTHVFTLHAFEHIFEKIYHEDPLLKCTALKSTIVGCFNVCYDSLNHFLDNPTQYWKLYVPHNATISFSNYDNIRKKLKNVKGVPIEYAKYLFKSMLGFLYYAKYTESKKKKCVLESTRLINKSLDLDYSCVKLRAATFFYTIQKYSKSIEICDTFLNLPPTYKPFDVNFELFDVKEWSVSQILNMKTTEEIENIMKEIASIYFSSPKLTSLLPNSKINDTVQNNLVSKFRNYTNLCFSNLYMDVTFMTAEKWVVPDPILYELLLLSQDAKFPFSGIHLDPSFVGHQIKFLCYHSTGNVNGMADMLELMNSFITTETSYEYLNMFVYCQIKAGHHRQSVKSILQSMRNFPSMYNAASGYMKVVLQILNSLFI